MKEFDIIVVGGGPAGYNCAEYAARQGKRVLVAEKRNLGGTCLNVGCIPTKTFLYASKLHHYAAGAGEAYGIRNEGTSFEQETVVKKKDEVVKTLVRGVAATLQREKVQVVYGAAEVAKQGEDFLVIVGGETFAGKYLIIATGSAPWIPSITGISEEWEKGNVVTSNELLSLTEIPERLVIVGGGVIGFEMAAYFQEAGSQVAVIEMMDKVLGPADREVSALLQRELEKKGVVFYLSSSVTKISEGMVTFTRGGKEETAAYDKVLMAVGRRPSTNVKGLKNLGVAMERRAIAVDEHCQTNLPGVYAIGDVNGKMMLAHVGYRQGEVAVNHILGRADVMSYDAVCSVVYTNPEAAFVGVSEEQAKSAGISYEVKKVSVNFSGRHVAENGLSSGICKILIDRKKETVIGAAILSSYASEYIYSLALMIENQIPLEKIRKTVFPHPTVCEIIREALLY